jgi:hypothetical protein
VRAESLHKEIHENVETGSEMFTDAWVVTNTLTAATSTT